MREHFKFPIRTIPMYVLGPPGEVAKYTALYLGGVVMTSNEVAYWQLQEQKRSNLIREAETERTNKANEKVRERQASVAESRAKVQNTTDYINAATGIFRGVSSLGGLVK